MPSKPTMHVKLSGKSLVLRSGFSADSDLVLTVGPGANGQFGFRAASLVTGGTPLDQTEAEKGVVFHRCGDDSTPWNINGTYIGGNHGCSDARVITSPEHGLSDSDLGSEWHDEAGSPFYLIRINSHDSLWFLGANSGRGAVWKFNRQIEGQKLIRGAGGEEPATLQIQDIKMVQLTPACRIKEQTYLADGYRQLPQNVWIKCSFLEVLDDYDIISPASVLQDVVQNPGQPRDFAAAHLEAVLSNRIRHLFYPGGATVIRHQSRALQDFNLGYMGFIQTAPLLQGNFDTHEYYVPGTLPFTAGENQYDFQSIQDFSGTVPVTLNFGERYGNVAPAVGSPSRFLQFLGNREDGKVQRKIGYALGYSPLNGLTRLGEREKHAARPLWIYTSRKTYPQAIDTIIGATVAAGTEFDCTAYRQYFDISAQGQGKATALYWHRDGDDILIYADYHSAVEEEILPLPREFAGRRFEIVVASPSVKVVSGEIIPPEGLLLSVTGKGGSVVLRVSASL